MIDACPKCGGEMTLTEKDTSSGWDMRTYTCQACGESVDVDNGKALWQILSEDREITEAFHVLGPKLPEKLKSGWGHGLTERLRAGDEEALAAIIAILESSEDRKEIFAAGDLLVQARGPAAVREITRLLPLVTGPKQDVLRTAALNLGIKTEG